ncbi:hypothetical protein [Haloactinomyces albus]|uniref:mRNA-degrading endonuclease toxin of MazEF toxin-antitoxin module n=1 Tax=Haloactinomyces albus TaxID=1352928 RepID=A0AAE3ZIW7_9ACTN|nr:hypothetical protein [Haloactinomyces albus]MDR7304027.1 mRNA-degrading endonuclease toxin of MazEF toxin-antitoxin module [Haloactinomyces albus]
MSLRRGEVWTLHGYPLPVVVVSGGMYNDQPQPHSVLAMPVLTAESLEAWTVPLADGQYAVVDRIRPYPKEDFRQRQRQIDARALAEVDTLLFKILATN